MKILKKLTAAVCAVAAAAACAVSAMAEYPILIGDLYIEGGTGGVELTDTEVKVTGTVQGAQKMITGTYAFEGEELELEFWQAEGATLSCDVMLETEGVDVFAYMPGFAFGYAWVEPANSTPLVAGEWVTVTETMDHFYQAFKDSAPSRVLIQVRNNSETELDITVRFKNFRINYPGDEQIAPGEDVEVETPAQTTLTQDNTSGDSEISAPDESAPAATTAYTSIDYSQYLEKPDNSNATVLIVVIIVVAVIVVAAALVGFIIYRKKKYY